MRKLDLSHFGWLALVGLAFLVCLVRPLKYGALSVEIVGPVPTNTWLQYDTGYGWTDEQKVLLASGAKTALGLLYPDGPVPLRVTVQTGCLKASDISLRVHAPGGSTDLKPQGSDACETELKFILEELPAQPFSLKVLYGLVAAGILGFLFLLGRVLVSRWRVNPWFSRVFVGLSVWHGLWWLAQWPGLYGWDSFAPLYQFVSGQFSTWYSLFFLLVTSGLFQLTGSFQSFGFLVLVLNVSLYALVLSWALENAKKRLLVGLVGAWVVISPVFLSYNFFLCRDVLTAPLIGLFLFGLWSLSKNEDSVGAWPWIAGAAAVAAGLLRTDNLMVFALTLLIAFVSFRRLRKLSVITLAVLFVAAILMNKVFEPWLIPDIKKERAAYANTAFVNPLGGYVYFDPAKNMQFSEEELNLVRCAFDDKVAREKWTYKGLVWPINPARECSDEELRALKKLFVSKTLKNLDVFLGLRMMTFVSNLGLAKGWLLSDFSLEPEEPYTKKMKDLGIWRDKPLVSPLFELSKFVIWGSIWKGGKARALRVFWFHVPQILMLLWLLYRRRWDLLAFSSVFFAIKTAVFFLAAPAAHFFYLFDLHQWGVLAFTLHLSDNRDLPKRLEQ